MYLWNSFAKIPSSSANWDSLMSGGITRDKQTQWIWGQILNRSICFISNHVPRFVALEFANQTISRESNPQKKNTCLFSQVLSNLERWRVACIGRSRPTQKDYDRLLCCWLRPSHHKGHLCWLMQRRRQHHACFVRENENRDILQYRIFKQYLCWKPLNNFKHHCPFLLGSWHIQADLNVEHLYSMVLLHIAMPSKQQKTWIMTKDILALLCFNTVCFWMRVPSRVSRLKPKLLRIFGWIQNFAVAEKTDIC